VATQSVEEDELRQVTALRLAGQMERNARLIERCEALALAAEGDPVAALNAASRLLKADAAVAAMLARLAHVETRHRALIDVNKPTKESQAELNRKKSLADQERREDMEEKLWRQMNLHVENAIRARMGDPTAPRDRIAAVLKKFDERNERRQRAAREEVEQAPTEAAREDED
jgi:hypothetical protein